MRQKMENSPLKCDKKWKNLPLIEMRQKMENSPLIEMRQKMEKFTFD